MQVYPDIQLCSYALHTQCCNEAYNSVVTRMIEFLSLALPALLMSTLKPRDVDTTGASRSWYEYDVTGES